MARVGRRERGIDYWPGFVDALVISAGCRRPIRFVMDHQIFKTPLLNFIFRTGCAIPIAPARDNPQLLERAYDEIAQALKDGDLVGIFPEGATTRDGEIQPFRNGIKRIIELESAMANLSLEVAKLRIEVDALLRENPPKSLVLRRDSNVIVYKNPTDSSTQE